MGVDVAEMLAWTRHQIALDSAALHLARAELDLADLRVIKQVAAKYAGRPGYREQWRP